jgi:hypothetical protein
MSELVFELSTLPAQMQEWIQAMVEPETTGVVILRRENGRVVFQRPSRANPEVMRLAREVAVEYKALFERLADA